MTCFSGEGLSGESGTLARDPGRGTKLQALRLAIALPLCDLLVVVPNLSRQLLGSA